MSAPEPGAVPAGEKPDVSVVIPVGDNVSELAEVLRTCSAELNERGCTFEFVVVLDGVVDSVFEQAKLARPEGANVRLVRLNHPFGESTALSAGFSNATGEVILTMPPYLQIEAADIHRVLNALEDGLDVVAGHRLRRVDPIINRLQSKLFNSIMRLLTGINLHDMNCPVRALRRKVVDDVTITGDMVRFLPIMAQRHGFRVGEAKVRHLREQGKSGFFGIGVYVRRFLDVINLLFLSKVTRAPLRFFGVAGILFMTVGTLICLFLAVDFLYLDGDPLRNRVTLIIGVMMIVLGVQIFSTGLVGEIIIFTQAKNLKEYRLFEEQEVATGPRRVGKGRRKRASPEAADGDSGGDAGGGQADDQERTIHRVKG